MSWQLRGFERIAPVQEPLQRYSCQEPLQWASCSSAPAPLRETLRAASKAAATSKALIDGPLLYVVGQSFEQHSPSTPGGGAGKLRGVFYHEQGARAACGVRAGSPEPLAVQQRPPVRARMGDFRQCLGLLLSADDSTRAIGTKLYAHFAGNLEKLPQLLQLLEDKWGFPSRVFPLLWTQLRRTRGSADGDGHVSEESWVEAFVRWLQVVWVRCSQTKVSRQCFVQTRSNQGMAKVYFMGALLGEGSYGQVHLALHTGLGLTRVVKSVPKTQLEMAAEQVEDEVAALKAMDHPHIVRVFEAFETDDALHIVMDYAEGGDLASVIRSKQVTGGLPEVYARIAAGQILSALCYMHSKGIIHCDLKPQNIMLLRTCSVEDILAGKDEPHMLLVDFGLAEIFEESPISGKTKTVKGTPSYLAPEGFDGRLSQKSDAWSFGVVLFEMLSGQKPYRGTNNVFMIFCQIMKDKPPLEEIPSDAQELVGALLTRDPGKRLTAEQCLQHAWFHAFFAEDWRSRMPPSQALLPAGPGFASYFYRTTMFCAASALGMKDVQDLFEAFKAIDTDRSGYLTRQQLTTGLARYGVKQDPVAVMASLDLDQDERISLTEFLAGVVRLEKEVSEPLLRHAFTIFDTDGDGFISRPDLQDVLAGNGPSADMLPDGRTVDQVMEEVSCGEGAISFESFLSYLKRMAACSDTAEQATILPVSESTQDGTRDSKTAVEEMVDKLITDRSADAREDDATPVDHEAPDDAFPSFDLWLEELYRSTKRGAALGWLLVFEDGQLEASYVAQNIKSTCRRVALLAIGLLVYSMWAMTTENAGWWPRWAPGLRRWGQPVHAANNLAWLVLAACAVLLLLRCASVLWPRSQQCREGLGRRALHFEHVLCGYGCILPWVTCYLANRTRLSALFGVDPSKVFESVNSDYDLIITFLGTLMFITTLTHARLMSMVPITLSCVLAYVSSATLLGAEVSDSPDRAENWLWPCVLLLLVLGFNLWGHRTVEQHRRLIFLSLHASYVVLCEAQDEGEGDATLKASHGPKSPRPDLPGVEAKGDTRYSRLKRSLNMVQHLADSMEVDKPLHVVLHRLLEVLNDLRDDVAQTEAAHLRDINAALQQTGPSDGVRELLLGVFDALPASEPGGSLGASYSQVGQLNRTADRLGLLVNSADAPVGHWGWDLLSGRQDCSRPLAAAGEDLLLQAVAAAATSGWCCGPRQVATAHARARHFLECLAHPQAGRHSAEARCALALRAAAWLAQQLGLWERMEPWERVALLAGAAGLHSGSDDDDHPGHALLIGQPFLTHAASMGCTLKALDASGLSDLAAASSNDPLFLKRLVSRFLVRLRPQCSLGDTCRVRVQLEKDDRFPATAADRALLCCVTLAAADLAFLALPLAWHKPWALLCQVEARRVLAAHQDRRPSVDPQQLDMHLFLQGLIEALALPLYEALSRVGSAGVHLAVPLRHLRDNLKHWKAAELVALPATSPGGSGPVDTDCTAGGEPITGRKHSPRQHALPTAPSSLEGMGNVSLKRGLSVGLERQQSQAVPGPAMVSPNPLDPVTVHAHTKEVLPDLHEARKALESQAPPPPQIHGPLERSASLLLTQRLEAVDKEANSPFGLTLLSLEEDGRQSSATPPMLKEPLALQRTLSVELPALSGNKPGLVVPATEELLSKSVAMGAMMLVVVADQDKVSARPRSAGAEARGAWRTSEGPGSSQPCQWRPSPPQGAPTELDGYAATADGAGAAVESAAPEHLLAWVLPEGGSQSPKSQGRPPFCAEGALAPQSDRGGPQCEQSGCLLPPPPDPLLRAHSYSVTLQSLLENVLEEEG